MRTILFLPALIASLTTSSIAISQDLEVAPKLYRVTGVADNDTLNIREMPDASSEIIGEFGPHQTGIEVVTTTEDGRWGLVNSNEQSGWTAMRFLASESDQINLPRGLTCSGTEPFWSLDFKPVTKVIGGWDYMGITEAPTIYQDVWTDAPINRSHDTFGFSLSGQDVNADGIIRTEMCDDGMSDRSYGFSVDIILHHRDERLLVSGCCSLSDD